MIGMPQCLLGAEQQQLCRLHHHGRDELEAEAETAVVPPQWRWRPAEQVDVRIGIYDGGPIDLCRCSLQFAVLRLRELAAHGADDDDLTQIGAMLFYALGPAVSRAVVEVASPRRPPWLPAAIA
jgi:hypothetical protein